MLDITETSQGYEVKFQYKPYLVDAIKQIPGRKFIGDKKHWFIPLESGTALKNWAKNFGVVSVNKAEPQPEIGEIEALPELTINIPLLRAPFPYQNNGIAYAIQKRKCIFGDQPGLGKAQPLTAKIPTPYGWIKMADVTEGMQIYGGDGRLCKITGVFPQGIRPVFKVTFNDGASTECDLEHLWPVRTVVRRRRGSGWLIKTTKELLDGGLTEKCTPSRQVSGREAPLKWEVPISPAVNYPTLNPVIAPYILGVLIGDGCLTQNMICFSTPDFDNQIVDRVSTYLPCNLKLTTNRHPDCPQYFITQTGTTNKNPFKLELERLGLLVKSVNKFIPVEYLQSNKFERLELLRGLMDTDGSASKNRIVFHTMSLRLANDVVELVQSLGGLANVREYDRQSEGKGLEYQVNININECPFSLNRKAAKWKQSKISRYIKSIEFVRNDYTQCIKVDNADSLYLTDQYIVTHNTGQAIAAAMGLQAKCILVICPATLRENWKREWKIWTGKEAMILKDSVKTSWPQYYKVGICNIFIVNYESLKKYFVQEIKESVDENGKKKPLRLNHIIFRETVNLFDTVIIDESHRCKDGKTQQAKFVMGIARTKENIFALTGTPVVNKPIDLIPQLTIINRLMDFGGYTGFTNRYCQGSNQASNLKELNYRLHKTCFFRREKRDVLKDLPDKMRNIIRVDITNRAEYNKAEHEFITYLKENLHKTDSEVDKSMRGEVMVRMGVLKQIAAKGKVEAVKEFVSEVSEAGEKIGIFAWHKEIISELKKHFPNAVTLVGDDKMSDRQVSIDRFQNDPNVKEIFLNIKSGGVGITLTASSRGGAIELPWHPADCDQIEDRFHRIGQKNSVQFTYFLGHNTIDEYIYSIIEKKRAIANQVTGAKEVIETNMVDEFINLFMKDKM